MHVITFKASDHAQVAQRVGGILDAEWVGAITSLEHAATLVEMVDGVGRVSSTHATRPRPESATAKGRSSPSSRQSAMASSWRLRDWWLRLEAEIDSKPSGVP